MLRTDATSARSFRFFTKPEIGPVCAAPREPMEPHGAASKTLQSKNQSPEHRRNMDSSSSSHWGMGFSSEGVDGAALALVTVADRGGDRSRMQEADLGHDVVDRILGGRVVTRQR